MECARCGVKKLLTEFHRDRRTKDGIRPACRMCEAARHKRYRAQNPDKVRDSNYRRRYGITADEYEQKMAAQGGLCNICRHPETVLATNGSVRALCVDHCHSVGIIRDLLCSKCNQGIGMFLDDPILMRAAADYAEHHQSLVILTD